MNEVIQHTVVLPEAALLLRKKTLRLIEFEPPLPFIFLIAFQTFCVCVLKFNLEQKSLHEHFFCCLTTWRALTLKYYFFNNTQRRSEKNFRWASFLSLIAFSQLSLNHWTLGSLFERRVFSIASPAAWIRSVNWLLGSSADMAASSISSGEHWAWKYSQSALRFHLLGMVFSSTALLVRITTLPSQPPPAKGCSSEHH